MSGDTNNIFEESVNQYYIKRYEQSVRFNVFTGFIKVDNPEKYKYLSVSVSPVNDVQFKVFTNIEGVFIGNTYKGDLSFVNNWNLKRLIINQERSWEEISSLNLKTVESLDIRISDVGNCRRIDAPALRNLTISFNEFSEINRVETYIDLSGLNNLERLVIKNGRIKLDNLGDLPALKSLSIYNINIGNLKWVSKYKTLESLVVSGCNLKDVSGVEHLERLRKLDLNRNNIKSIMPVSSLYNLEYLNIYRNDIADVYEFIDGLKLDSYVYSEEEFAVHTLIHSSISDISRACDCAEKYSSIPIDKIPFLYRKTEEQCRSLAPMERIQKYYQLLFLEDLNRITPENCHKIYSYNIKSEYINRMMTLFPFLRVPESIMKEIEQEKEHFCEKYTDSTQIVIAADNVFAITVNQHERGEEGSDIVVNSKGKTELLKQLIFEIWEKYVQDYEIRDYCFNIEIQAKYSQVYYITDIAITVVYAMLLAIENKLDVKRVLVGTFGIGENCEKPVQEKYLYMAKQEGADKVVLYGNEDVTDLAEYGKNMHEKYGVECIYYEFISWLFQ